MKYLGIVKYDGNYFHGFQRQNNLDSVQKTLEDNVSILLKEKITIKGAGRTDAKVHALGQTFHFNYEGKLPKNFVKSLNKLLAKKIILRKIKKVDANF